MQFHTKTCKSLDTRVLQIAQPDPKKTNDKLELPVAGSTYAVHKMRMRRQLVTVDGELVTVDGELVTVAGRLVK